MTMPSRVDARCGLVPESLSCVSKPRWASPRRMAVSLVSARKGSIHVALALGGARDGVHASDSTSQRV
jgi:hypothetical protein